MPIALDPDQTLDLVLTTDKGKPEGQRPTFVFRYLTSREWSKVAGTFDTIQNQDNGARAIESICESLRVGLVGWRNMTKPDGSVIEYDPAELDGILTPGEAMELLQSMLGQTVPDGEALGKSEPPQ